MSPREEYHTVRLPKGWTPAKIIEFAKVVDLLGRLGQLGIENAALRRERRALRKIIREAIKLSPRLRAVFAKHLEKRQGKARRAGRTK